MSITVRPAVSADYRAAFDIMSQVQQLHIDWRPDIYKYCDDILPKDEYEHLCSEGLFYVAECDGRVAGILGIQFRHIENQFQVTRNVVFIDSMAVDGDYRGRGIGHAFFEMLKEMKKERKLDGIELQVNARNLAAYDMYVSCGFRQKSINMELPDTALVRANSMDLKRLSDFYKSVIEKTPHMAELVKWRYGLHPSDEIIQEYIDSKEMYYVEENGRIIAALAVTGTQNEEYHTDKWQAALKDDEVSVVHLLAVNPDVQKQSVASRVMKEVLINARMANKKAVRLDALYSNTPAHRLYESLGFCKCGIENWYVPNLGETDFVLYEYLFQ